MRPSDLSAEPAPGFDVEESSQARCMLAYMTLVESLYHAPAEAPPPPIPA